MPHGRSIPRIRQRVDHPSHRRHMLPQVFPEHRDEAVQVLEIPASLTLLLLCTPAVTEPTCGRGKNADSRDVGPYRVSSHPVVPA